MIRHCIGCGELINPKRIEILPNTKTCVNCSTTKAKRGIPVLNGDINKDDTWVDIVFLEPEEYEQYDKTTDNIHKIVKKSSKAEFQNYDEDDNILSDNVIFSNLEEE